MSIIEIIQKKLDQGDTASVFVDLKKAFNTVDHDILKDKFEHYGVRGVTKEWFCSYLKNRRQFVSIDGFVSNTKRISTGVLQGGVSTCTVTVLNIYNDLQVCAKFEYFADDTNILTLISHLRCW